MKFEKIEWFGFEGVSFEFEGRGASVIMPSCKPNGRFALKTEYKNAFPQTEIELLRRGWHVAFNENLHRWATEDEIDIKASFIKYVAKEFSLAEKCVPIGMSCGGLYALRLAIKYPSIISALYLDAPVMNFLSCPGCFGKGQGDFYPEFFKATGISRSELINYREHPVDKIPQLLENKIPVILVSGDSDTVVPYDENGIMLEKYYREHNGEIYVFIKKGADHHPHGLENVVAVADLIEQISK